MPMCLAPAERRVLELAEPTMMSATWTPMSSM